MATFKVEKKDKVLESDKIINDEPKLTVDQQLVIDLINKIATRQEKFEEAATIMINKQSETVNKIMGELEHLNKPLQQDADQVSNNLIRSNDGFIDKDGIQWGVRPASMKKDEFSGNKDMDLLNKLGIDKETATNIVGKIIDSILGKNNQQQNNMGAILQEFMVRDFFDNYQSNKAQSKAMLNMLVKKNLLSEMDVDPIIKNMDITNDPIKAQLAKMSGNTNP